MPRRIYCRSRSIKSLVYSSRSFQLRTLVELRVTRGRPPSLYVVVIVLVVVMPAMRRPLASDVDRSIKFPIDVVALLDSCVEVFVDEGSRRCFRRPWKAVSNLPHHHHHHLVLYPVLVRVVFHHDSVFVLSQVGVVFHLKSVDWVRVFLYPLNNLFQEVWGLDQVDFTY